jgi:PIN domain nuclease of toxin-antitoxin system
MRLLLDTHILLWLMTGDANLDTRAKSLIVNASEVYVSSASIWEIAIKARLGRIEEDAEVIVDKLGEAGLRELHVNNKHAVASGKLPLLHRDPFDRMLVAQAMAEPMRLLTADVQLSAYSELVITI